ncbi:hypothetical protein [Deefgea rivuli]|jgi:hypothetical protein|uniref:hypothetical protein n=1 Tax=Deefgea rivuli TaxID=400948 RepID=UPI000483DC25|nr:hypothetical protein [Deefgea rivuli]
MSRTFDMASGQIDPSFANERTATATCPQYPQNELALRLLTVAESEEQQPVPRPRPWLFK